MLESDSRAGVVFGAAILVRWISTVGAVRYEGVIG